ncbi:MAG: hypothetical protein M1821_002342 [Bathelium mastoideum]|nr:MAG: hypothetical protein M1821_002342 [Bathelium mastoideum]
MAGWARTKLRPVVFRQSSFAIDHLQALVSTAHAGLAYIYFERQETQQQNPSLILRCLLKQLAKENAQIYQYLEDLHGRTSHPQEALTSTAIDGALNFAILHFERLFLVLDSLDQCDEVSVRRPLLTSLLKLQEAGARIMVTSRPHPADIQWSLSENVKFEVQASEEDMVAYIDYHLHTNPRARRLLGGERKDEIVGKLIRHASGMFLPIPFQLEYLSQQLSVGAVFRELDHLEENISRDRILDHIYDRSLEGMERQLASRKATAMKILNWLMFAKTTMSAPQLSIALAVERESYETDEVFLLESEIMTDVCNGFVTIDEDSSCVRFAHPTVQEYLMRKLPGAWDAYDCALTCARYLSYTALASGACLDQETYLSRRLSLPFFDYAARYLTSHVKDCAEEHQELVDAILRLLHRRRNMDSFLQVVHCPNVFEVGVAGYDWYPKHSSPLHVAATIGYEPAAEAFLRANGSVLVSSESSLGQTPLHVAAKANHASCCKILLHHGADACHTDRYGYTPMAWAVWGGHFDAISVFAERDNIATILETKTNSGETLLHLAAQRENAGIALALLRMGSDPNAMNANRQTPLDVANAEDNTQLANVLISATALSASSDNASNLTSPVSPTLPFVDAVEEMTTSILADPGLDLREPQTTFDLSNESTANGERTHDGLFRTTSNSDAQDGSERPTPHFLGADQFARVVEFSDAECVLRPVTDDLRRICEEDGGFLPPTGRKVWYCRLDTDVNLRCLALIDPKVYMVVWLFAYQIEPGFQPTHYGVQTYNCSIGKPLDAAMFASRTRDPAQPFISTNLNAIILPRITVPLEAPKYETQEDSNSSNSFTVTRLSESVVILVAPTYIDVDWDGPTAFLIKSVSSRFMRGSLMFLGALLYESTTPDLEQGLPNGGRATEVR